MAYTPDGCQYLRERWGLFLVFPTIAYLVLTLVSLAELRGRVQALAWLMIVVVMLLLDATRSAWDLMVLMVVQTADRSRE